MLRDIKLATIFSSRQLMNNITGASTYMVYVQKAVTFHRIALTSHVHHKLPAQYYSRYF